MFNKFFSKPQLLDQIEKRNIKLLRKDYPPDNTRFD